MQDLTLCPVTLHTKASLSLLFSLLSFISSLSPPLFSSLLHSPSLSPSLLFCPLFSESILPSLLFSLCLPPIPPPPLSLSLILSHFLPLSFPPSLSQVMKCTSGFVLTQNIINERAAASSDSNVKLLAMNGPLILLRSAAERRA